jgi:hypothetical protein
MTTPIPPVLPEPEPTGPEPEQTPALIATDYDAAAATPWFKKPNILAAIGVTAVLALVVGTVAVTGGREEPILVGNDPEVVVPTPTPSQVVPRG